MNRLDWLLGTFGEEGVEVSQRISKMLRFGCYDIQPGQPDNNVKRLMGEVADFMGTFKALNDLNVLPEISPELVKQKQENIARYLLTFQHRPHIASIIGGYDTIFPSPTFEPYQDGYTFVVSGIAKGDVYNLPDPNSWYAQLFGHPITKHSSSEDACQTLVETWKSIYFSGSFHERNARIDLMCSQIGAMNSEKLEKYISEGLYFNEFWVWLDQDEIRAHDFVKMYGVQP